MADAQAVADHISRAENDAYERVAAFIDAVRDPQLAKAIRAMKHKVK
jgi:hypothetical protein